jgi:hypothetical protein
MEEAMNKRRIFGILGVTALGLALFGGPVRANVITDWDEKAVVVVTPMSSLGGTSPYMAVRMMGMVHAAMFDAVNSIERRYRPYLAQLPAGSYAKNSELNPKSPPWDDVRYTSVFGRKADIPFQGRQDRF